MAKAIGLLSGGLDSTLAVKIIIEQGVEVVALNFVTPFCTCTKKGCRNEAKKVAERFGIELKVIGLKEEYINLVKEPKYGYGKNMNPCIDCRIFMFSEARKYMEEIGADFVFTGEVLGQRPMSQNLRAMRLIEREAGLYGRLLRPLSAKFFEPTIPEREGVVNREKLLNIQGRSRKPQINLAHEKNIFDYPCPAGGCRLTDPNFARRLKDAFKYGEDSITDIMLLRFGRHFRLPSGAKVIVGRNERENLILKNFAGNNHYVLFEVKGISGPVTLLTKYNSQQDVEIAARICLAYSDSNNIEYQRVGINQSDEISVVPVSRERIKEFMV
ncbi:MAG: 7-cyano-7-deazaguanine synthase [candidate division WOR-3 bacterium]